MLFRYCSMLGAWRVAFRTVDHRVQMLDAHGNSVIGPLQFTAYNDQHRTIEALKQTVRQGT
eukprot:891587-Pyramimonas_sp.AAC.1